MGVKRRSYHLVNQTDFSTIKTLLGAGLSVSKITEITGRSSGVIGLIKKSNTLNDYRHNVRAIILKYTKPKVKVAHEEEEVRVINEKPTTLSDVVEALNKVNATLERLAVAWETRPAKRGLFGRE